MAHEAVECPRCGELTTQLYHDEASVADPDDTRCPLACGPCLGILSQSDMTLMQIRLADPADSRRPRWLGRLFADLVREACHAA